MSRRFNLVDSGHEGQGVEFDSGVVVLCWADSHVEARLTLTKFLNAHPAAKIRWTDPEDQ